MIILQNNRILVDDLIQDSLKAFFSKNTVYDSGNGYSIEEKWTCVTPVTYKGKEYLALPRLFPKKFISEITDDDTVINDNYYIPFNKITIENKTKPRNDTQVMLLDFLVGRNEYKDLLDKPRRGLFANTGIGKTFLTLKYISGYKLLSCIFCPDDRAINTWIEESLKFTNLEKSDICVIKGRNTLESVLKSKVDYKLYLFSNKTASSLVDTNDENLIVELFTKKGIALKVFDEFHLYLKTIFHMDMNLNTYRTFYLTATNKMRIFKENIFMGYMTPSKNCVFQQEKEPRFELINVKYYSNPEEKSHIKGINKLQGFDGNNYLKYILNDKYHYKDFYLNKVVLPSINLAKKKLIDKNNHKIAILFKNKESCYILYDYLKNKFPTMKIGIFNSDIKDMEERKLELDNELIISTDKSFAGIINIYNLSVIINTIPIGSDAHLEQIVGRIREESNKRSLLIQLTDLSFKKLKNSLYREEKILEPSLLSTRDILVNKPSAVEISEE